jgi:pimeloyl-ACP methyl ester carboxylesterase
MSVVSSKMRRDEIFIFRNQVGTGGALLGLSRHQAVRLRCLRINGFFLRMISRAAFLFSDWVDSRSPAGKDRLLKMPFVPLLLRVVIFRFGVIVLAAGGLVSCGSFSPEKPVPVGGVETYERVTLGGVSQAIQIRGERSDLPVLLFLHGGPGIPEMPVSRIYGGLEKEFIVVHWDQRGTGLSYDPSIPAAEMKVENFVNDTLELTELLKKRFNRKKIYLAGFSFGSEIGILAVKRKPENFQAYIGISQFLDLQKSEEILDRECRQLARDEGDLKTLHRLEEIGPPPYRTDKLGAEVNRLMADQVKRHTPHQMGTLRYVALVPGSKAYRFPDLMKAVKGRKFVVNAVADEFLYVDITPRVRELEVPCYFLLGRWDRLLSATLVERYEQDLIAPKGKRVYWFDHTGHAPHLEEPGRFVEVMGEIRKTRAGR